MKRILLSFIVALSLYTTSAQVVGKAIGARIGEGTASSIEFSYQHPLTSTTRFEADAYTSFDINWASIGVVGLHQWVFNIENGFQWFLGAGGSIGTTSYKYDEYYVDNNYNGHWRNNRETYFTLALHPNGGAEYNFKNIPLQLAVDGRPSINLLNVGSNKLDFINFSLGVAARYRFK